MADLDTVYVPIGLGSGICGVIGTRDLAWPARPESSAWLPSGANAYRRSVAAGRVVQTNSALTFADGMAVRVPDADCAGVIRRGAERIVEVSDDEIAEAIRILYSATHNGAEGAGAASLAALMKERDRLQGRRVAVILTGQNIDRSWMQTVLAGGTPLSVTQAVYPPSIANTVPTAKEAASQQSQSTAAAISSVADSAARRLPDDLAGDVRLRRIQLATGGVSIQPGQIAQMRGPLVACSSAALRVRPTTPCLAAEYAAPPEIG